MPVTVGTAIGVGKQVLQALQVANATREEHQAVGALVGDGLTRAICQDSSTAGVSDIVDAVQTVLRTSAIPGEESTGFFERGRRGLLRFFRIRHDPPSGIGLAPLSQRLGQWVERAAEEGEIPDALKHIDCPEAPRDPAALGDRFDDAFLLELLTRPDIPYRERLTTQLAAEEYAREFAARTVIERASRLGLISTAAGGATYGLVEGVIRAGDVKSGSIAGGIAILSGGIAAAGPAARRRMTDEQQAVKDAVTAWIADLLGCLTGGTPRTTRSALVDALNQALQRDLNPNEGKSQAASPAQAPQQLLARPPPALLADLTGRLIPRAREANDRTLAAALIQLEDRLVRWNRVADTDADTTQPRRNMYPALLGALDASG
jgi:hypothetical protein